MFKSEWTLAMNDIQRLRDIIDEAKGRRDASDVLSTSEETMFNQLEA